MFKNKSYKSIYLDFFCAKVADSKKRLIHWGVHAGYNHFLCSDLKFSHFFPEFYLNTNEKKYGHIIFLVSPMTCKSLFQKGLLTRFCF